MIPLIEIDGRIVGTDVLTEPFCCDLAACRGMCCIEGDAGAPITLSEAEILEREYDSYKDYMSPEARQIVESAGFVTVDEDGEYTTPLVEGRDCVFSHVSGGIAYCAVEKAFLEGRTRFRKPVSCHLYPIRVRRFSNGTEGLAYDRWSVCASARECGQRLGVPVYRCLETAIRRAFGDGFFESMCEAERYLRSAAEQQEEPDGE